MQGRTVRLFLVDGSPTGLLTAEIMNWTGHILVGPRSRLGETLVRPEASRTGVYFLTGDDPDQPTRLRVYVGEGDNVVDRIKSHAKDSSKEFWTRVCIVTSKDANLTKAHVRYLESRILELAKNAGRAVVANGNEPSAKQLPESDVADMEFFLSQLQIALPIVGLDFLRQKIAPDPSSATSSETQRIRSNRLILISAKNHVLANALEADGEIIVLTGSYATTNQFVSNTYAARRNELIRDGTLVEEENASRLVFTKDTLFQSPSEAAAVILNRNSNGRTEWKLEGTNQTLKDWQDSQLDAVTSTDLD